MLDVLVQRHRCHVVVVAGQKTARLIWQRPNRYPRHRRDWELRQSNTRMIEVFLEIPVGRVADAEPPPVVIVLPKAYRVGWLLRPAVRACRQSDAQDEKQPQARNFLPEHSTARKPANGTSLAGPCAAPNRPREDRNPQCPRAGSASWDREPWSSRRTRSSPPRPR